MSSRPTVPVLAAAFAALPILVAGCSRQSSTEPGTYAISGHVQLVGNLVSATGQPLGTRTVEDADGVPVDLVSGRRVVARTRTSRGAYQFGALSPGSYSARVVVFGSVADSTATMTIARQDVSAPRTLRLASYGDLLPTPNPIDARGQVYFGLADTTLVTLQVLDVTTAIVRHISSGIFPDGLHVTFWDGKNDTLGVMPAGAYWLTFTGGGEQRATLLFK